MKVREIDVRSTKERLAVRTPASLLRSQARKSSRAADDLQFLGGKVVYFKFNYKSKGSMRICPSQMTMDGGVGVSWAKVRVLATREMADASLRCVAKQDNVRVQARDTAVTLNVTRQ